MNINRLFNALLVADLVSTVTLVAWTAFEVPSGYEEELATLFARHETAYDSPVTAATAIEGMLFLICMPIYLAGLWRRRRWGALLYIVFTVLLVLPSVSPDRVFVDTLQDRMINSLLWILSGFTLAFILLRREDLGFPPLFGSTRREGDVEFK